MYSLGLSVWKSCGITHRFQVPFVCTPRSVLGNLQGEHHLQVAKHSFLQFLPEGA